ncbi:MAG: TerC family protein [Candidatus Acidiferrales bacterium]
MTELLHIWLIFLGGTLALLAVDLFVLHRKPHEVRLREALLASAGWISLALLFNLWIYFDRGGVTAVDFLTAYLVEKSLSIDNVMLFVVIFRAFQIPAESQHRVLYYGVLGALLLRAAFIFGGVALIEHFHPVVYIFGGFLLAAGGRLLFQQQKLPQPDQGRVVHLAQKWFPVTQDFSGAKLFVRRAGQWLGTPLLLALIAVEISDILFAVDSVPAVLAITRDTFIAYTSNVFAILGLRSLYFALAGILPKFRYLHQGLAAILMLVGAKMLLSDFYRIPSWASLAAICGILTIAAILSTAHPQTPASED